MAFLEAAGPSSTSFSARTWKEYTDPLVRLVRSLDRASRPPLTVDHDGQGPMSFRLRYS